MMYRFRIALTSAVLVVVVVGAGEAQATFRETGSLNIGGNLVWVRGTNERSVQLFVGRGYHDAFARPHEVDAVRLQHWIDSVRAVKPLSADDTTEAQVRLSVLSSDVTLMRRSGGPFSGMRVLLTGEDPITMAEPTAKDFLAILDSAARVSRELSTPTGLASGPLGAGAGSPSDPPTAAQSAALQVAMTRSAPAERAPAAVATVVVAPPVVVPEKMPAVDTVPAKVIAVQPAQAQVEPAKVAPAKVEAPKIAAVKVEPAKIAPAKAVAPLHAPVKSAPVPAPAVAVTVAVVPKPDSAIVPVGATVSAPAPELVLPEPQAPVLLLASRVEILPLPPVSPPPAPAAPMPRVTPVMVIEKPAPAPPVVAAPVVAPTPAPPVIAVAAAPAAVVPAPVPASSPVTPPVVAAAPPAPDSVIAPKIEPPADKLIHTPLGPFTIPAELLSDRDKEAQYCYRKLGLKYSPDLAGEITVKLSVGGDGTVSDAAVTKRTWQGISAGEVEACVRALAHDWTFPASDPAVAAGAKLLTFTFAP